MNINTISKQELKDRLKFRCIHRHNGIAHANCFDQANGLDKKIGCFDIESSNLKATYGIVFSYCIKELDGEMIKNSVTPEELKCGIYDKRLMQDFCTDARKFDKLIGYYSSRFDIPFLRSRCIYHNLDFPIYAEIKHTDLYMIVRNKLNLHSKRLGAVCDFFGIPAKEHGINSDEWFRAMQGDQKALDYILLHCQEDVLSTEALWNKINCYARITDTSI